MGNIKTCVDTSREKSSADDLILEEKFRLLDEAHKRLIDPVTGDFRTMSEVLEEIKKERQLP